MSMEQHQRFLLEKGTSMLSALSEVWEGMGVGLEERTRSLELLRTKICSLYDLELAALKKRKGIAQFVSFPHPVQRSLWLS